MGKMDPVVHFEMGYLNKERMIAFYRIFGWEFQDVGTNMGNYVVAHTTETDAKGMVQTKGAINGGFYQKTEDPLSAAPSVVISVDDMKAAMDNVVKAGGRILGVLDPNGNRTMEPQMIPGVGLWMSVEDTEGNRFSIIQP